MFESEDFLYYPMLIFFGFGIPFALFKLASSFYYLFKWIFSRDRLFLKAAIYCIVDGTFSIAFASVGIWVVLKENVNLWLVLLIGWVIEITHMFIARKFREDIFFAKPADINSPTPPT